MISRQEANRKSKKKKSRFREKRVSVRYFGNIWRDKAVYRVPERIQFLSKCKLLSFPTTHQADGSRRSEWR